jgi:hypothetical protein
MPRSRRPSKRKPRSELTRPGRLEAEATAFLAAHGAWETLDEGRDLTVEAAFVSIPALAGRHEKHSKLAVPADPAPFDSITERDGNLIVRASPAPKLPPPERIIWRGIGPNGQPCTVIEGNRIKEWGYTVWRSYEPMSRAQEWIFQGPQPRVDDTERRLTMIHQVYFGAWLRDTRPRMRDIEVERAVAIAEWYVAETSGCLVYRGRSLTPERYGTIPMRARPPGAARAAARTTAAAFRVRPAAVRRILRLLRDYCRSAFYREKLARYDDLAARGETHLL